MGLREQYTQLPKFITIEVQANLCFNASFCCLIFLLNVGKYSSICLILLLLPLCLSMGFSMKFFSMFIWNFWDVQIIFSGTEFKEITCMAKWQFLCLRYFAKLHPNNNIQYQISQLIKIKLFLLLFQNFYKILFGWNKY